ncbi:MAG: heavy metal translocating P-type ATPase [Burkholderiaceae bacterium]
MEIRNPNSALSCFHCSLPVPPGGSWHVEFDGKMQPLCCAGCEAVAGTIFAAGLEAFYRQRPEADSAATVARDLSATLSQAVELGALQADIARPDTNRSQLKSENQALPPDPKKVDLVIEGMHCGACVWLLEQGLQAQPGVSSVSVNLANERASVSFDASQVTLTHLLTSIAKLGYRALPFEGSEREAGIAKANRTSLQRLFVAGIGMMQVMMVALPGYLAGEGEIENQYAGLLRWSALVLTTPVILYSAWPFFLGAYQSLRFGRVGMDVPVSIGLLSAYLWSVYATISGDGEVYFDSVAMFVFLLLLARHLQWLVRRRSLAQINALGAKTPTAARQIVDGQETLVSPSALRPGDTILVASGQAVPVDAQLTGQATSIDQSVLTGESVPVGVTSGDLVPAGSFVCGNPVRLMVTATISDSAVSRLESLVAGGFENKPRLVVLADRVAAVFVSAVILLAIAVWVAWIVVDSSMAWPVAMTVLVVSCPCALSLATPSALSAATSGLIRQGILVTQPDALEALASATDIVFDKTGTLTQGEPTVTAVDTVELIDRNQALGLAAALETGTEHPFARALRQAAARAGCTADECVTLTDHQAGHGVAGFALDDSGGRVHYRLGSARWCGLDALTEPFRGAEQWAELPQSSEVFLVSVSDHSAATQSGRPVLLARFALTDPLRQGAEIEIRSLAARDLKLHLLSGDKPGVVNAVAEQLGIKQVAGGVLPADKQTYVERLQAQGKRVVMIGDGMNDAPVLSMADASIAFGRASDLARTAADVIALNPSPAALSLLLERARMTRRVIAQNLLWAATYNGLMIPAAALGWVAPWAAAIGMALSSWLVVANASRLWHHDAAASAKTETLPSLAATQIVS